MNHFKKNQLHHSDDYDDYEVDDVVSQILMQSP